jgi:TIR domain
MKLMLQEGLSANIMLQLDLEANLPQPFILDIGLQMNVPTHRVGNFYDEKTGPGCDRSCIWNGGGYYMDEFVCGQTYPSGKTFYCSSDCHVKMGKSDKVFLSYRWGDSEIANKVTNCLKGVDITIIRDLNELDFLDFISSFMNTSAQSRYFVAIMTESYFYSRYCMYEFCQMAESKQLIRTIPILLGKALEPGIEETLKAYWSVKYQNLNQAISGIHPVYTNYLQPELNLLASIPGHVANFYAHWRAKERPKGDYWLMANCRYLAGSIKTTFRPTDEDATNWTFSNRTVRGEQAKDVPAPRWKPQPFYLHAYSKTETPAVTGIPRVSKMLLSVYYDGESSTALPGGIHVALISESALNSLTFCSRLEHLLQRDDVNLVPIFLDTALQLPASEVYLLRQWYTRLTKTPAISSTRYKIDSLLRSFGTLVGRLRDIKVPSVDSIFAC